MFEMDISPGLSKTFPTSDGVSIAVTLSPSANSGRLVILSPGFAQHRNTPVMRQLAQGLTDFGEVAALDHRGTGGSGGRYGFGWKEYLDLEPLLEWGRRRGKQTVLVGCSMGGYHCLRAAAAWPQFVDRLLMVSPPSVFEDVLGSGGAWRQALHVSKDWKLWTVRLRTRPNVFFRYGHPFRPKPPGRELAAQIRCPAHILAGERDHLVFPSLSREIHRGLAGKRSWTLRKGGEHAEVMYLQDPARFLRWVELHL